MELTFWFAVQPYSVLLLILLVSFISNGGSDLNPQIIEIDGPGLRPDKIVMPARYFFVYMYGKSSFRNDPLLASDLKVDITGQNIHQRDCRVWINVLDRKDGSFIVRYKLYETCFNMEISVTYKQAHIGSSPFKITSTVHPEDCYCPLPLNEWLHGNNCPSNYTQINEDLTPFSDVQFSKYYNHVVQKVNNSGSMSVCNYIILNNEVHRKCYGQHVGFKMFVDAILTSLARKMKLPDIEIFVNLGDWPLVQKSSDQVFPMFSWCGSKSSLDILMPTYDITESSLEAMGRVSLDMLSLQGNIDVPWEAKEPKAFWRGRDSNRERLKLVDIARKHPDLFNASLVNYFFFRDQEEIYGKEKHISFFKFFDYRYQIAIDGTVAAYRLPYLLAGDSLVIKQDSDYYEHFYAELEPWKHFVPIKKDLSDLVEKVKWARDNDEEAHKIALNGQRYARSNLLPEHIFCYHAVLINEWSKRLKEKVKLRKGMEKVPQTENKHCLCSRPLHDEF